MAVKNTNYNVGAGRPNLKCTLTWPGLVDATGSEIIAYTGSWPTYDDDNPFNGEARVLYKNR